MIGDRFGANKGSDSCKLLIILGIYCDQNILWQWASEYIQRRIFRWELFIMEIILEK